MDVPDGSTVRAAAALVEARYGVSLRGCMVAINDTYASPTTSCRVGTRSRSSPVAGGSDETTDPGTLCEMTPEPLSLAAADLYLVKPQYGAQAYFVGTVRSPNQGKDVEFIEYEGYGALARKVMHGAADAAREKHGELRVYIQHRVGRLLPGEASILIGVASPHRRAALEACDDIIEYLKVHVPVWKHEGDEDGQHWVPGQTGHDTL